MEPIERTFLYMPLMHAEDLAVQERSVALFTSLAQSATAALAERLAASLDYAVSHRSVIARFGRFPGRNAALGRHSTSEERADLEEGGSRF